MEEGKMDKTLLDKVANIIDDCEDDFYKLAPENYPDAIADRILTLIKDAIRNAKLSEKEILRAINEMSEEGIDLSYGKADFMANAQVRKIIESLDH
jgi:non-homologous end joining protein Ku